MLKKYSLLFLLTSASYLFGNLAIAQGLTNSDIDNYINSLEAIQNTTDPVLKSLEAQMNFTTWDSFPVSSDGQVNLFQEGFNRATDEQKNALSDLAKESGFSSISDWISISDRLMGAYIKLNMQKNGADQMPELTPEMLQYIPANMRVQVERSMQMLAAAKKAPQADVDVVEANYQRIEEATEKLQE